MKNEPLVSIIMPTYNAKEYIGESIESVLNQTYQNWELLIADDHSSDATADFVKNTFSDNRINYFLLEKNVGAAKAREHALRQAKGAYVAFLDSDDIWVKEKLAEQLEFMISAGILFCATEYKSFDTDKKEKLISYKKEKMSYEDLLRDCPGNSTIVVSRTILEGVTIPNLRKRNDYVFWLQLIKSADYIWYLKKPLTYYRRRDDSISSKKLSLLKYHWKIYYEIEKLGLLRSIYYCYYWSVKGIKRKIGG